MLLGFKCFRKMVDGAFQNFDLFHSFYTPFLYGDLIYFQKPNLKKTTMAV